MFGVVVLVVFFGFVESPPGHELRYDSAAVEALGLLQSFADFIKFMINKFWHI